MQTGAGEIDYANPQNPRRDPRLRPLTPLMNCFSPNEYIWFLENEVFRLKGMSRCKSNAKALHSPEIAKVQLAVVEFFRVGLDEITGNSHLPNVVFPRHVGMYLCRKAGFTLHEIGRAFGKDHTSVIHACKAVQDRMDTDPKARDEVLLVGSRSGTPGWNGKPSRYAAK